MERRISSASTVLSDCIHIPAVEDSADDARTDPIAYFRSLSGAQQDQVFTRAGAQAIRDGADIYQVVDARRGTYTAGGRTYTRTGTTRRGLAGLRLGARGRTAGRLTTDQIYLEAAGDRDEAVRLLELHGYII